MLQRSTSPDTPPVTKSAVAHVSVAVGAEKSDAYARVIARLNDRWRVVSCRDCIQWILQTRYSRKAGGSAWTNRYYCRSREGLVSCCREYSGEISGDALVILLRLPAFHGEAAK